MKIRQTLFFYLQQGVAAGILLAPHSGAKTRKKDKKRNVLSDLLGGLNDKISEASDTLTEKNRESKGRYLLN